MKIIVCLKQVPDPDGSRDSFIINQEINKVEPKGIPPVVSLFDENALEAAARIKDAFGKDKVRITLLSVGKKVSNAVMLKALAAGADELVKVEGESLDSGDLDSYQTASLLVAAIKKIDNYDLILVGRQAADWNAGQVGIFIAMMLGIPVITLARKIETDSKGAVLVEKIIPDGYEVLRCSLPAVIMASNEVGELRYPTIIERRDSKKKPITTWTIDDIGFDGVIKKKIKLHSLYKPEMKEVQCEVIAGEIPADVGRKLARKLKEVKVI
jgi:electron transfer flavoprotein beta subunit